jgi:hypothetical protein
MKVTKMEQVMVTAIGGWYVMVKMVLVVIKTMLYMYSMCVGCFPTCSNTLGKWGWKHKWIVDACKMHT